MVSGIKTPDAVIAQIRELAAQGLSNPAICARTGLNRTQVQIYAQGHRPHEKKPEFQEVRVETALTPEWPVSNWIEHPTLPAKERPVEDIIKLAKETYQRNRENHDARKLINVRVRMDGPVGVAMMGDPHLDDRGCNWPQLTADLDCVAKTNGMMLSQIGDVRNNWVGRLAKLYAKQSMTCGETRKILEWFFKNRPWLFMVKGNHDHWNSEGGDVLDYLLKIAEVEVDIANHDQRVAVHFPNGNIVSIRARHEFQGKSINNINHGAVRAAKEGRKFDIYVHGHLHTAALQLEGFAHGGWGHQADQGIVSHFVRLGSYKEMDEFSDEIGAEDKNWAASMVAIMNPYAKTIRDKVTIIPSIEHGCDYLAYLRRRWESGRL